MTELIYSKKFENVKRYYHARVWTKKMVWNAVDRWITADEYQEITGEPYMAEETASES